MNSSTCVTAETGQCMTAVAPEPRRRTTCHGNGYLLNSNRPLSRWADKNKCQKNRNIVYIKVHKAASSTMNQILLRYGLNRNKIVALPKWWHYFDFMKPFHRSMALDYEQYRGKSELLISHARLNRPEMDAVVEDAIYLASLRRPAAQFESAFGYFEVGRYLKTRGDQDPMEVFMSNPEYYSTRISFDHGSLRNQQMFDLGLEPEYFDDTCAVERKIKSLDEQLDLVLIADYLDESLVLMKYLLCLDFNDILYIPANVRSNKYRTALSKSTSDKIEQWNAADSLLYQHFNRSLWRRIELYGEQFAHDLRTFKQLNENFRKECIRLTDFNKDRRLWNIGLKHDAAQFCKEITIHTVPTIRGIRSEVIRKYGTILDKAIYNTIVWGENAIKYWQTL